jgi:hypothetical protein
VSGEPEVVEAGWAEGDLIGQAMDTGRVVRPGDVLVLSTERDVTQDSVARLRGLLHERFPELADILIMAGVRFEFVYRKDDEP